jgi:transcriptional regulator with XRE-family HTH domain
MSATKLRKYPIFDQYTVEELARRLPYAESYLSYVKAGYREPTRRLQQTASGILNQTIEQLWGEE